MAIVKGTEFAEEVYYNVDLAFRHLLNITNAAPVDTVVKVSDVTPVDSVADRSVSKVDPVIEDRLATIIIGSSRTTMMERDLMKKLVAVALSMGLSIDSSMHVQTHGPWKFSHGCKTRLDEKDSVIAYIVVNREGFDMSPIVKATMVLPYINRIEMALSSLEEYKSANPFVLTEKEKEKFVQTVCSDVSFLKHGRVV